VCRNTDEFPASVTAALLKDGKERAQLLDVHLGLLATKNLRRLNRSIKPVRQQREISV
jgi:hypothetical protein